MDVPCISPRTDLAKHRVVLAGGERELRCEQGQDVLNAAIKAGVNWLPVGCRGGGCGVCRVIVRSGSYDTGRVSKRLIGSDDTSVTFALSCKLYPTSDLELEYAPVQRSPA